MHDALTKWISSFLANHSRACSSSSPKKADMSRMRHIDRAGAAVANYNVAASGARFSQQKCSGADVKSDVVRGSKTDGGERR
jgi:hypothetical protein